MEQAQAVGDCRAASAQAPGEIVLRNVQLFLKAMQGLSFFHRIKILTLQVFDQPYDQSLAVSDLADQDRNLVQPGQPAGPPPPFAGDDLIAVWPAGVESNEQRL
jgi:hypothetical protein